MIKAVESKGRWGELTEDSTRFKERGDCGVRALAVATGKPYAECHAALKAAGRRNRAVTWEAELLDAARALGFQCRYRSLVEHVLQPRTSTHRRKYPTMKQAAQHGRIGVGGIFAVTRHWAGWDGEKVVDWADNTRKRVKGIWDLFPREAS